MSKGFDNLGQMFQGSRSACVSQDDLSSADSDVSEVEEPAVNLPIWNNLSEKARSADIKLQKVQRELQQ